MALLYIAAGTNHFVHPETYRKIMPHWLPVHRTLVLVSGIMEILLGVLLLIKSTRRLAAAGIILLLIAVFPANVQMMLDYLKGNNPLLWLAILRLPLQGFLIWWTFQYAKPVHR